MPQLMPLMWVNSIGVCLLIVMMLVNLYNLKEEISLMSVEGEKYNYMIKLMW